MKQQPWKISIVAQSKGFNFKFRASRLLSPWKLNQARFNVVVNLRRFVFKASSKLGLISVQSRRGLSLKSNIVRVWEKFRIKCSTKRRNTREGPNSSSFARNLALLSRSISGNDQQGTV